MKSFKIQGSISALIVFVLVASTGLVSSAPVKPDPPVETASARVIRDTGYMVDDEFYRNYILGLGKTTDDLLREYEILHGDDDSRLPRLQTMPPAIVVGLNDSRGALEQLWTSICEVESFLPWLEEALADEPALSNQVLHLQGLANASVIGLRNHLVDFETCYITPHSTPPSVSDPPPTRATTSASTTTTAGGTSPGLTTLRTVDISLPCAPQLQLLRPQPQPSAEPYRLPAILDGMLAAVARLDAIVKRDFS